ncbi:hypothetical protein H4684_002705 [Desulfomicrobium macestii]|uniref:Membrane fusion protein biotin-lipoyl like domain-containing protein n=1 Tax=Desulfomicrobium macestii TaxID=90731 RepID=A0ABR9H5R7_9BACT|nr:hypothetical protein [Desulfomicrobium macestii]MBE1426046.1 hypothetical protein [Desulfomicrobium macestii]
MNARIVPVTSRETTMQGRDEMNSHKNRPEFQAQVEGIVPESGPEAPAAPKIELTRRSEAQGKDGGVYGFVGELRDLDTKDQFVANIILIAAILLFVVAVSWAAHASLDEVVRGFGKVIPSSDIKRVQNFEGGIVKEILVREGELVSKGQLLILLDQIQMESRFREQHSGYLDSILAIARLEAELNAREDMDFPEEILKQKPHLVENQRRLLRSRNDSRRSALSVLECERAHSGQTDQ